MIAMAGYHPETHKVVTEDQYILTIHRIVGSGPVVFMQHGLEDSSSAWVLAGTDHGAPGFRLAEQGYDVWLGNFRGNHYSRAHATLNPDKDNEFWQFSWDEMAKIDLVTLLAPVAYIDHMRSPMKLLVPFSDQIQWIADHMGLGEFMPSNWLMNLIAEYVCGNNFMEVICENIVFLMVGYDQQQMNKTMMSTIASHCPSGTSSYAILQYAQEAKHKQFGAMDWGTDERNIAHHGTATPPLYHLKDVNTRVALFWGDNDWLTAEEDLFKILIEVPNVAHKFHIEFPQWNHLDHLYAIDIDKYQNDDLVALLAQYPIE